MATKEFRAFVAGKEREKFSDLSRFLGGARKYGYDAFRTGAIFSLNISFKKAMNSDYGTHVTALCILTRHVASILIFAQNGNVRKKIH